MSSNPISSKRVQFKGLIALLTLSLAATAGALGTTAGSTISNTGFVDYTTDDGVSATATSIPVSATVLQVYAVTITPDGITATPGQTVYTAGNTGAAQVTALTYTLKNPGNGTDSFTLSTAAISATVTAAGGAVSYYIDAAVGGTANVYDPGIDTLVSGAISLAADATKTFYAVYTVPAAATGGTAYDLTPGAVSVGDATKTDVNNLGRIIQKNLYSLSFAAPAASNVTTPGAATYTQTLTNTGNTALSAAQIALSGTPVDTVAAGGLFTHGYQVTYNGVTSASFTTPQAALAAAMGAGTLGTSGVTSTATLITTITANNLLASGNTDVLTLGAAVTGVTNSVSANNNTAVPVTLADTTTVVKGAGSVTKTQALCGLSGSTAPASCPASSGAAGTAISVRPGDYVVYYISATNSGTGNILGTKVRDLLPAGVSIYSLGASSTQAGTVLYSINGATWTPTAGTLAVANGATVYAAVDTNADGTITAADTVAATKTVLFRIKVKVNDGGAVNTAPQTDAQIVN
jgi:uncharacterized repeat protein (TIGR01451 family)